MAKYLVVCMSVLAVTVTAFLPSVSRAAVTISSPANGASPSSPVKVVASASEKVAISEMEVWIDGAKVGTYPGSSLSESYTLSTGAHRIAVLDNNSSGTEINETVVNITVVAGGPIFSPAGGTYAKAQSVTISGCKSLQSIFYTTNGYAPTIASKLYTGAITVSSNTTLKAICATATTQQNSQATSKEFACHTAKGGTWGSLTCDSSGGVSNNNPKNITVAFGSTATETISPLATASSETQALWTWFAGGSVDPSGATCDGCTEQVQDIIIKPTVGNSVIANNEMDMPQYDVTHGINRQNGLQCNQQAGIMQWQVDSGNSTVGDGWADTGITDGCPLSTTAPTEVVLEVTHSNSDTGCGGYGCANYKQLCINGNCHALNGTYGGSQGYKAQSGESAWGRQDQIDVKGNLGSSPVAGRIIYQSNVSLGIEDESPISSANYGF